MDPILIVILLIIGVAGIVTELLVPGLVAPGVLGVVALSTYFVVHYVNGHATGMDIFVFIIGIVLLLSELFIPSYGLLGITGGVMVIYGVVVSAEDAQVALYSLGVAVLVGGAIVAFIVQRFQHRAVWNKLVLRESLSSEQGFVSQIERNDLLGQQGRSLTPLRPAGMAKFGHERIDVVTDGQFVAPDVEVIVIKVEGARIVVEPV